MLETCIMSKSSRAVGSFALDCTGSRATVKLGRRIGGFIQEIFREQPDTIIGMAIAQSHAFAIYSP